MQLQGTPNRAPLRVLYFGTYRSDFTRNNILINGLRQNGAQVIECHETLWKGIEDRVRLASGGWRNLRFAWRVLRAYARLLGRYLRAGDYDVMVVGYPGQFDVFLGWLLTRLKGRPLCWDILMSIYLVSIERRLDQASRFTVNLIRRIERMAGRLPDLLILESPEYVNWFCKTHRISPSRFCLVPLGAGLGAALPSVDEAPDGFLRVAYFGSFLPSHGVDKIIGAAQLLAGDPGIQLEMIGSGPDRERAVALASQYGLRNITFAGFLEQEEFDCRLARADVVLGVFGDTAQSMMTIQNKVYESLAMGKALITGESALLGRTFEHGRHMYICSRTPEAIAEAVRSLRGDPALRKRIAREGQAYFDENFRVAKIGERFLGCLEALHERKTGRGSRLG